MNPPLLSPPQGPLQVSLVAQTAVSSASSVHSHEHHDLTSAPRSTQQSQTRSSSEASGHPHSIRFSLVIPTYNEGENIGSLIAQLTQLLEGFLPNEYELILVDDDSPDGTWQRAQVLSNDYPQLKVMRRQAERGLSSAVIRGWQMAQGEILGVIDADLQHPPEVLLSLLQSVLDGADLAVASRHIEGGGVSDWSIVRRFLSRGAQLLGLIVCPSVVGRVSDPMSGYFMVRRSAIAGPELNPLGYKILLEVIGRGNIGPIAEAGYVFQERESGESKVTWKQYIEYLGHLVRLRSSNRLWVRQFPTKRFLRYGIVGFSGVFVDMILFYLFTDVVGIGLSFSKFLAAEVAIVNNFLWNDAWTFADLTQRQRSHRARVKRLLKFNIICFTGLVLDVFLLLIFYKFVFSGSLKYVANLIAIILVATWNFWLNVKLSWRITAVKDGTDESRS
ncbi:MAG: glycosyltransferase [Phormidesmis sp.]